MIIHYLKMAFRSLMRYKVQNIISMIGLVFSMACVFILVRYVHQEYTANHFINGWDRTYFTTVVNIDYNKQYVSESTDRNRDKNYKDPLDDASVEAVTRFVMIDDYPTKIEDISKPMDVIAIDSAFFDFFPYPCVAGTTRMSPNDALITAESAERLFGKENPVGKTIEAGAGKLVSIVGVLGEPSTKSSLTFDIVFSKELRDWSRIAVEMVRLYNSDALDALNKKNNEPMQLRLYGNNPVYYKLEPVEDVYFDKNIEVYYHSFLRGDKNAIRIHIIISLLILLVGLFNYINLYTAIIQKRNKELSMKKIFGAGKFQVFFQLYIENVVFNALSLFFVWLVVELTRGIVSSEYGIPVMADGYFDVLISGTVLLVLPIVVLVYPYFRLLYNVPILSLKISSGRGREMVSRFIFLFLQYVITFGLTISAIYFTTQLKYLYNTDVGYKTYNIVKCRFMRDVHSNDAGDNIREKIIAAYQALEKRISESPLFDGMVYGDCPYDIDLDVEFTDVNGKTVKSQFFYCGKEYMDFFGFNVVDGRGWNGDDSFTQYKMIVNKAFVKAFGTKDWRNEKFTPNKRLWWSVGESDDVVPYEVVGVMDDFRTGHLSGPNMPMAFIFHEDLYTPDVFLSIAKGREKEALSYLQELYNEIFENGELEYSFIEDDIKKLHEEDRKLMMVVITFAIMAVCISCLGLFGLSLYDIRLRYREIGLRKVHGANVGDIYRLVMKKYVYVMVLAYVIGTSISYVVINKYMETVAHKSSLSWWMFIVSGILVIAIVFLTLYWQINKAARINPSDVIKTEY